jgi:hypothetical protein
MSYFKGSLRDFFKPKAPDSPLATNPFAKNFISLEAGIGRADEETVQYLARDVQEVNKEDFPYKKGDIINVPYAINGKITKPGPWKLYEYYLGGYVVAVNEAENLQMHIPWTDFVELNPLKQ